MTTELVMESSKPMSRWTEYKYRLAIAGATGMSLVGYASAETVNFTPIQELLEAVVDLIPTFMDLVVSIAPLIVIIAIVGFVLAFLDRILGMLKFG
jgi:hypothetical protein